MDCLLGCLCCLLVWSLLCILLFGDLLFCLVAVIVLFASLTFTLFGFYCLKFVLDFLSWMVLY